MAIFIAFRSKLYNVHIVKETVLSIFKNKFIFSWPYPIYPIRITTKNIWIYIMKKNFTTYILYKLRTNQHIINSIWTLLLNKARHRYIQEAYSGVWDLLRSPSFLSAIGTERCRSVWRIQKFHLRNFAT